MNNTRKTILAPTTNHEQIIKNTLKEEGAMFGTSILPFNVYLNQFTNDAQDRNTNYALAYQAIQTIKDQCSIISRSLVYPEIVQQLINFTMDCIRYGIEYSSLPQTTQKEKDIAICLHVIWPLYQQTPNLDTLKQKVTDASDIEIYPFNHSLDEQAMIDYLASVGASLILPETIIDASSSVFFALNHAKEAEALAQHIINNDSLSTLVVCCETSVLPTMLTSAFKRYNIDTSDDISSSTPLLVDQYLSLFHFIKDSSMDYLQECIHNSVFPLKNPGAFLEYILLLEVTFEELLSPFTYYTKQEQWVIVDQRDVKNLVVLETAAEKDRQIIMAIIQKMNGTPLVSSFEYFASNFPSMNHTNQQALLSLKELIEKLSALNVDTLFFDSIFLHCAASITPQSSKGKKNIHITSLSNSYQPGFDQVIVVGANQQNYPGFSKQNGIIDEQYLLKISFPSLENRLTHHLSQLQHIPTLAPKVLVSYATSTFDGKVMAPAYELLNQLSIKPKAWQAQTFGVNYTKTYNLDSSISQSLFLKDNNLYGSVSSFEVFYHCQYRYFLKSGMKLSENDPKPTLVALIGSISHAIVENLTQHDAKQYAQLNYLELFDYVAYYFKDLHTLYPKQKEYWDYIAERLTQQLTMALKRLDSMEKDTEFTFDQAEKRFSVIWELPDDINLNLIGFIDRIDTSTGFFRIVDYKSSEKNLSIANVKAGLQLQLLTYLVVAKSMYKKQASGAFYYSFLNKNVDILNQKLSNGKIIPQSIEDDVESFYKGHKLAGWFVNNDSSMYESDWFIKHLTKTGKINKGGLYDLEKIESLLMTLYTNLSTQLQQGRIDRNPVQGACDYCDYKHICIFKGSYRKANDIDLENTLKQGD